MTNHKTDLTHSVGRSTEASADRPVNRLSEKTCGKRAAGRFSRCAFAVTALLAVMPVHALYLAGNAVSEVKNALVSPAGQSREAHDARAGDAPLHLLPRSSLV